MTKTMVENMASCDSLVVDYSSHNPKVMGLSQPQYYSENSNKPLQEFGQWQQQRGKPLAS